MRQLLVASPVVQNTGNVVGLRENGMFGFELNVLAPELGGQEAGGSAEYRLSGFSVKCCNGEQPVEKLNCR